MTLVRHQTCREANGLEEGDQRAGKSSTVRQKVKVRARKETETRPWRNARTHLLKLFLEFPTFSTSPGVQEMQQVSLTCFCYGYLAWEEAAHCGVCFAESPPTPWAGNLRAAVTKPQRVMAEDQCEGGGGGQGRTELEHPCSGIQWQSIIYIPHWTLTPTSFSRETEGGAGGPKAGARAGCLGTRSKHRDRYNGGHRDGK